MKKLLCLLLFCTTASWATNQIEFDLGRGTPESYIQANGSDDRQGGRGTAWSADILHQTSGAVYVGLGGGYFHSNDYVSPTFAPGTVSTIDSHAHTVLLLSRLDLTSNPKFLPYALVGAGWVDNELSVKDAGGNSLISDSKSTYGYALGLGVDIALNDRLFVGLETRYQSGPKQSFSLSPEAQALTGAGSVETRSTVFLLGLKAGVKY